jgi:hypothetical protein
MPDAFDPLPPERERMPQTAAAGEVYEVVLEGRQESQQVLNVMHFQARGPVDDVELRLLRALVICLLTTLRPIMGANYQFVRCYGKRVTPDLGPIVESLPESGEAVQGADEGDTLPTYVSVVVNIHSTRGGRSGRGRMFIPGVPESASQGSFIPTDNPYWTAIRAYLECVATQFIAPSELAEANKWAMGVMSRKIGGAKPPYTINGFARATALKPNNALATTRSRKVGHGS